MYSADSGASLRMRWHSRYKFRGTFEDIDTRTHVELKDIQLLGPFNYFFLTCVMRLHRPSRWEVRHICDLADAADIIQWTFPTLIIPCSLAIPIRLASEEIPISPVCSRGRFIFHVRLREALLQLKARGYCTTVHRNGRSKLLGLFLVPNEKSALWLKGPSQRRLRLISGFRGTEN